MLQGLKENRFICSADCVSFYDTTVASKLIARYLHDSKPIIQITKDIGSNIANSELISLLFLFSVVTSVSIVDENDPMEIKKKYMTDYEKYAIENQDVSVTKPR